MKIEQIGLKIDFLWKTEFEWMVLKIDQLIEVDAVASKTSKL